MAFLKAIKCFKSRAKVLPETMYRVHLESEGPYGLMLCGHETIQCLVIVSIQKSKAVKAWNSDHPHCPWDLPVGTRGYVRNKGIATGNKMYKNATRSSWHYYL